jgi:hypothetical protein
VNVSKSDPSFWRRAAVSIAAFSVLAGATCVQAGPADLQWGEAIYQRETGDELGALTHALLVQQGRETWPQTEAAELWRFDTLIRWGLHNEAAEVLVKLDEQGLQMGGSTAARDAAWFRLAELRYRKGLWLQAEEALTRIRRTLPPEQETQRFVIHAQCLMQRGDFRAAAKVWKDLAEGRTRPVWARYNQALAQIKAGDKIAGLSTLEAVGIATADTEEQRQIRDKANLTMALGAVEGKYWVEARRYLERIPLQGVDSNKALLAYGWVALAQQGPQSALAPWMALLPREPHDPAVLEAHVAVPYAYATLGAKGKALQQYKQAIALYEQEQTRLDGAASAVRSGLMTQSLQSLALRPSGQEWSLADIPNGVGIPHLLSVWSSDSMQDAFQGLRDMTQLRQNIVARQARLSQIQAELAAQRDIWAQLQKQMSSVDAQRRMSELRQKVDALDAELTRFKGQPDLANLASPEQRVWLDRIGGLQESIQKRANVPEFRAMRDRLRMVQGVVAWQLSQTHQGAVQQLQKDVAAGRGALTDAQRDQLDAQQFMLKGAQRLDALQQKSQALAGAMSKLLQPVDALQSEYQQMMVDLTLDEVNRQKSRLQSYLNQARFAMAKLYDQAAGRAPQKESVDAR